MTAKTIKNTKPRVTNPKTGKVKVSSKAKIEQRSFVCLSINGKSQEYNQIFGANPKAAASKHFSSWCRKKNKKGDCSAIIIIKESWTNYLKNLIPECNGNNYGFKNIKQMFSSLCNLFTSNGNFLKLLKMYLGDGSDYEKSNYEKLVLDSELDV